MLREPPEPDEHQADLRKTKLLEMEERKKGLGEIRYYVLSESYRLEFITVFLLLIGLIEQILD